MRSVAPLIAFGLSLFVLGQTAHAELLIQVNKSTQRMIVTRDGEELYDWPVSTGGRGYETPGGTFKAHPKRAIAGLEHDLWRRESVFDRVRHIGRHSARNIKQLRSGDCPDVSASTSRDVRGHAKTQRLPRPVRHRAVTNRRHPIRGRSFRLRRPPT